MVVGRDSRGGAGRSESEERIRNSKTGRGIFQFMIRSVYILNSLEYNPNKQCRPWRLVNNPVLLPDSPDLNLYAWTNTPL